MRFILPLSIICLLLLGGCGSFSERQDRANRVIDQAVETVSGSIGKAKDIGGDIAEGVAATTEKINATVSGLEQKVETVQDGAEKISDAVQDARNAVDQVKEGVDDIKGVVK